MTDLERLAGDWPGWKFWQSGGTRYICATRKDRIADQDLGYLAPTLIEESIGALVEGLTEQQEREREPGRPMCTAL